MMSNLRDAAIVMWVVMQGLSWFMPTNYGVFNAQVEAEYIKTMDFLGVWEE